MRPAIMKIEESKPIIEGDFDWYKITFPFNRSIMKTTNKTTIKTGKERVVLDLIRNNAHLTVEELANPGLTKEGVKYHLNKLKKTGRIRREGSKKTGQWVVK